MGVFTSGLDTGNIAATTDLTKKSFAGMITRLMPNGSAPLFGMTSMVGDEIALAVEHGFFTKTMLFPEATINGAKISTDTTITVVDSSNLIPGMILQCSVTRENVLVLTVASGTSITIARAVGTIAAGAIADASKLYQVGTAFEEGSAAPQAINNTPVRITNYTQIFRNTWALTDTARATQVIAGETNIAESRTDCAAFHAADIEKALIFGQKSSATRNGRPFRTMEGLVAAISNTSYYSNIFAGVANVNTVVGSTTFAQLETMLDPVFNQNTDPKIGNERVLFVGGTARKVINGIGKLYGVYELMQGQTEYGLQFDTFRTTRGLFRMIEHPLFNTNTNWSKMAVAVDLSTFKVAYLGDRKTKSNEFNTDGTAVVGHSNEGMDAVGGTLTTELTAVVKNAPANAVIFGLNTAA
jgi:hypothetical protein